MASTPSFNWSTPDNTGLVRNGALDIRTLGNAIDTSMTDLLGGTTGQVLKKNSNTDMDFVWSADSAGMTNPMTTTGDTIYSSSGSTPARLGIGSTGQILTVAGGIPSWATPAASASGLNVMTPTSIANSGGSASLTGALVSASGVTSVSLNGVFTSTYTNYLVVVYELTTGNSQQVFMRMRASGTDTVGTSYKWAGTYAIYATGAAGAGGVTGGSSFDVTSGSASGDDSSFISITNPQAAKNTGYFANAVRLDAAGSAGGRLENTTQYDGLTVFVGGSTLTCKVLVYGLSN